MPYSQKINYLESKGNGVRILDKSTEILFVMTVCRYGLHNVVTDDMLNIGERTTQRNFVVWVVFMKAVFSKINLRPDEGHGLTDMVIDCTEFKL